MAVRILDQVLQLPAEERAELARNLWESLTDADRDRHFNPEQRAEIARRLAGPLDNGVSPMAWQKVRHVMQGGD